MAKQGADAGDALRCAALCMEAYEEPPSDRAPVSLHCGHTFCRGCITKLPRAPQPGRGGAAAPPGGGDAIPCPKCRKPTVLPDGGVAGLPPNYGVVEMIAEHLSVARAPPRHCWFGADHGPATHHCAECPEGERDFCDMCHAIHARRPTTRGHAAERLPGQPQPGTCSAHPGEPLKAWCATCRKRVCRDCAMFDHRDHDYSSFPQMYERHAPEMRAALDEVEARAPGVEAAAARVQGVEAQLAARHVEVRGEIKAQFAAMREAWAQRERELLGEVDGVAAGKAGALAAQRGSLTRCAAQLRACAASARRALDTGRAAPDQALLVHAQLLGDLRQMATQPLALDPQQDARLLFACARDETLASVPTFGSVSGAGTDPARCVADGDGLRAAMVGREATFTVRAFGFDGEARTEGGDRVRAVLRVDGHPPVDARAVDGNDGTYRCTYTAAAEGDAELHVSVNDGAVQGSPFAVRADSDIPLRFTSAFDTNGVLYHIATDGGKRGYRNPHDAGDVVAALSSTSRGGAAPPRFVMHQHAQPLNNYTNSAQGSWMSVDLGAARRLLPTHYCLRNGSDVSVTLRNWRLEGSHDNASWVPLRTHTNDTTLATTAMSTADWPVAGAREAYRYFRILSTGWDSSGGNHYIHCTGIELYGTLREVAPVAAP